MFINCQQNALINYCFKFLYFRITSTIGYCFEFLFLYSRITSTNKMSNFSCSAITKPKHQFYQVMLVEMA